VDVYLIQISPTSKWNASNLITYIAGFETVLGSIILGSIAIRQNEIANKRAEEANALNKQLIDLEMAREISAQKPCVTISDISNPQFFHFDCNNTRVNDRELTITSANLDDFITEHAAITITLRNATSLVTSVHYYMFDVQKDNPRYYYHSMNIQKANRTLNPNEDDTIDITFPVNVFANERSVDLYISLDLNTRYDVAYREYLHMIANCDDRGIFIRNVDSRFTRF
jgi:hypothetical protein